MILITHGELQANTEHTWRPNTELDTMTPTGNRVKCVLAHGQ